MAYVRGALNVVAAISAALFGPLLLAVFRVTSEGKATGFGALVSWLLGALLSFRFLILAVSLSTIFFAASRLSNKVLRIALFWIPTILCSALGLVLTTLIAYLWMHFIHFKRG